MRSLVVVFRKARTVWGSERTEGSPAGSSERGRPFHRMLNSSVSGSVGSRELSSVCPEEGKVSGKEESGEEPAEKDYSEDASEESGEEPSGNREAEGEAQEKSRAASRANRRRIV